MSLHKQAGSSVKNRQITICNKGFARQSNQYVFFPVINLSGKWLQEAGFRAGQIIDIHYEPGRLVITQSEEQHWLDQ